MESAKEPVPPLPQTASPRAEKKQRSGLLAFLNCCGSSSDTDGLDQDDIAMPAKKTTKIQPVRPTIAKLSEKPAQADDEPKAESRTPSTMEPVASPARKEEEERPIFSEKPLQDAPRPIQARQQEPDDGMASAATMAAARTAAATAAPVATQVDVPQPSIESASAHEAARLAYGQPSKPDVQITAPTPVLAQPPEPLYDAHSEDEDIEMADAPPETPEPDEGPVEVPRQPEPTPHILLPPPPTPLHRENASTNLISMTTAVEAEPATYLLPPVQPHLKGRKCLVLDLDETLVHSSFKILNQADFTIPVEIEGQFHNVYVIKRPGVDQFMKRVGELYEVVVFTASVSKYGDPLLDQLDVHNVVHHRLFRESCYNHQGNYVKVS